MPAMSFQEAAKCQGGHAGYSDPLDEQTFLVNAINALEKSRCWSSTAIIIFPYDDSDRWYDHVLGPIINHSSDTALDALLGAGLCGLTGPMLGGIGDRCGYSPRLPLVGDITTAKGELLRPLVS